MRITSEPQSKVFLATKNKSDCVHTRGTHRSEHTPPFFCGVCPEFILIHLCKSFVCSKDLKSKTCTCRSLQLQCAANIWKSREMLVIRRYCWSVRCVSVCVCLYTHIQSLILITLDRQDEFPSTF